MMIRYGDLFVDSDGYNNIAMNDEIEDFLPKEPPVLAIKNRRNINDIIIHYFKCSPIFRTIPGSNFQNIIGYV